MSIKLLGLTKTISYNRTKNYPLLLFSLKTAAQQSRSHSFSGQGVHTAGHRHQDVSGSVWLDQSGPDGRLGRSRAEYIIVLSNLTLFHAIRCIAAYLKTEIPTEFDIEDFDTNTSNLRTSTAWRVTF